MSNGIIISARSRWSAADWVVRNVAAYIGTGLVIGDWSKRAAERLKPVFASRVTDFTDATPEEMQAFYEAASFAYERARGKASKNWCDPGAYPEFVGGFEDLLELLSRDERVAPDALPPLSFR